MRIPGVFQPRAVPRLPTHHLYSLETSWFRQVQPRLPIHLSQVHQGQFRGSRYISTASPMTTTATDSPFAGTPRTNSKNPDTSARLCQGYQGYLLISRGSTKANAEDPDLLRGLRQGRFQDYRVTCTASPRMTKATDSFHTGTPRTIPRIPTHPRFAKDNQGY